MPKLRVTVGEKTSDYELEKPLVVAGRTPELDLPLPTPSASRQHFRLGKLKEGIVNNLTARRLDPVELAVKEHSAITIICSGFQKYEGSLAEKKGYPPPATGTVVGIIGADNSHKASS